MSATKLDFYKRGQEEMIDINHNKDRSRDEDDKTTISTNSIKGREGARARTTDKQHRGDKKRKASKK